MLKKIALRPGVNRENTRYTNEGGYYESDKIRFRQGTPEKIGGWQKISLNTFLGVCRSIWNWVTLNGLNLLGIGTNLKFYIERGAKYFDITPLRATNTLNNPFSTTNGSPTVIVTDASGGFTKGSYVTYSGATTVGGLDLNGEYSITAVTGATTYTITAGSNASSSVVGGGASVSAAYQIDIGPEYNVPISGWGSGTWSGGTWGVGISGYETLRLWTQGNFGEDLIFGVRGGPLYYWDATGGVGARGVPLSSLSGASDVPLTQNFMFIADTSRFVFVFGTNDYLSTTFDPMLVRWSDQESAVNWTPAATTQAGSIPLSHGSEIICAVQSRQEIVVFTDSSMYSLQYVGAPIVWQSQLLADNISIANQSAAAYANGVVYWMGVDKFYKYDGRAQTLRCDLRQYVYGDINLQQSGQIFAGTNEGFMEVWWFYCSANSYTIDRYVIYNYAEDVWYYGTMARTAWLDSGLRDTPVAATYYNNIVSHEVGLDDAAGPTTLPIDSYILTSEFDIDDGHNFAFIYRMLPDLTFRGSTAESPSLEMTLYPLANSGSGYNDPASVGGSNYATITRSATVPIEQFTGQVFVRVRGRQLALKIRSNQLGTAWQLGAPRIDIRPDGRR